MEGIQAGAPAPVVIEVWADLGCPWCYIGKHRLQEAIDRRSDADRFVVRTRSFQLLPDAPREPEPIVSAFIRSGRGDAAGANRAERRAQALVQREGLPFVLDRMNANTFDLHRVTHYAEESGLGPAFFSRVQDRYFAGELNPFEPSALAAEAEAVGLSGQRVREILAGDEYADAVRADIEEAIVLGVRGVPFTVIDRRLALSGAQSVDGYARALDEAASTARSGSVNGRPSRPILREFESEAAVMCDLDSGTCAVPGAERPAPPRTERPHSTPTAESRPQSAATAKAAAETSSS